MMTFVLPVPYGTVQLCLTRHPNETPIDLTPFLKIIQLTISSGFINVQNPRKDLILHGQKLKIKKNSQDFNNVQLLSIAVTQQSN